MRQVWPQRHVTMSEAPSSADLSCTASYLLSLRPHLLQRWLWHEYSSTRAATSAARAALCIRRIARCILSWPTSLKTPVKASA